MSMTAGGSGARSHLRTTSVTVVADVVVVGGGEGEVPALDAVRALGLRISRPRDGRALRALLDGLRQPAVVVVARSGSAQLAELARVRRARADLRTLLLTADPRSPLPDGVDELIAVDLPDDELMGRIVIHLAHARSAAPRRLPVADDTVLDLDARALRRRGRLIHLRPLESRLLEELARSPGRPLSRSWLMERAWSSAPGPGSRTVDVHVRWLRQKLEPDPRRPVHLLTIRGLGYQLEPDPGAGTEADTGR
jgi:DNA-binding response OmpR family regulator